MIVQQRYLEEKVILFTTEEADKAYALFKEPWMLHYFGPPASGGKTRRRKMILRREMSARDLKNAVILTTDPLMGEAS